ncbi:Uma2 family endonuclease [Dyadobacter psychrotolerans]|uniref:Uma2 family endonuclease n=1 Tax=Dyadobacter psychrotolerans TaxID=2541721 RepID=A0A4R5DR06_9BACT|nr:Uma2 family endonuclease [Dyadobacter psychrotolerans]TDE16832.1 Uma2 family endonuclease [Dyadobacter psychrotolerans]
MILQPQSQVLPRTFEEFLRWEPVDGFKYEWNDGEIIRFEKMKKKHLFIIRRLQQLFFKTISFSKGAALIMEQDVMLTGIQMRRPDLAYFSGIQIDNSLNSEEPIPEFVIEIISPTDDAIKVDEKLAEYFKSSVKVVWHIYPETEVVYIYTSRKEVRICSDDDICSASPVLPDFELKASTLFSITA